MKSALGRMPYVDIIWNKVHSNAERKTLKLVCKSFWDCHVADKYRNNYSETQKLAMEHVYCRGDCPNSESFKVILFIFQIFQFYIQNCFDPPLITSDEGEIINPNEEARREDPNYDFDAEIQPVQKTEWRGCAQCWEKFTAEYPEYKIRL